MPTHANLPTPSFRTLEEIQARKEELRTSIQSESQTIGKLWHGITSPQPASTKGEMVASLVSNSVTAIDAFLLVRKLMKTYGTVFSIFRKKKH